LERLTEAVSWRCLFQGLQMQFTSDMSVDPTLQPGNGAHAQACEAILLSYGHEEAAFDRFLVAAHRCDPSIERFGWVMRQYPSRAPRNILLALAQDDPRGTARWFDVAVFLGEIELAEEFLTEDEIGSPGVLRATINFCESAPEFALTCALAATTTAIRGNGARYSRRELRLFRQACARAASKCSSGSGVIKKIRSYVRTVDHRNLVQEGREIFLWLKAACDGVDRITLTAETND